MENGSYKGKKIVDAQVEVGYVGIKLEARTFTNILVRTKFEQAKAKPVPMFHNYCPFCGKAVSPLKPQGK